MNCPICLVQIEDQDSLISLHDNTHHVCQDCDTKLKAHFVFACPLCRHPINENLQTQSINNNHFQRSISDMQLLSFNISQEFINLLHIQNRIPYYYMGRFEGVDFICQVKDEYDEWVQNNNN